MDRAIKNLTERREDPADRFMITLAQATGLDLGVLLSDEQKVDLLENVIYLACGEPDPEWLVERLFAEFPDEVPQAMVLIGMATGDRVIVQRYREAIPQVFEALGMSNADEFPASLLKFVDYMILLTHGGKALRLCDEFHSHDPHADDDTPCRTVYKDMMEALLAEVLRLAKDASGQGDGGADAGDSGDKDDKEGGKPDEGSGDGGGGGGDKAAAAADDKDKDGGDAGAASAAANGPASSSSGGGGGRGHNALEEVRPVDVVEAFALLHSMATSTVADLKRQLAQEFTVVTQNVTIPRASNRLQQMLLKLMDNRKDLAEPVYMLMQLLSGNMDEADFRHLLVSHFKLRSDLVASLWAMLVAGHRNMTIQARDLLPLAKALKLPMMYPTMEEQLELIEEILKAAAGSMRSYRRIAVLAMHADENPAMLALLDVCDALATGSWRRVSQSLLELSAFVVDDPSLMKKMPTSVRSAANTIAAKIPKEVAMFFVGESGVLSLLMHRGMPGFWRRVLTRHAESAVEGGGIQLLGALGVHPALQRVLLALGLGDTRLIAEACANPEALRPLLDVISQRTKKDKFPLYLSPDVVANLLKASTGDVPAFAELAWNLMKGTGISPNLLLDLAGFPVASLESGSKNMMWDGAATAEFMAQQMKNLDDRFAKKIKGEKSDNAKLRKIKKAIIRRQLNEGMVSETRLFAEEQDHDRTLALPEEDLLDSVRTVEQQMAELEANPLTRSLRPVVMRLRSCHDEWVKQIHTTDRSRKRLGVERRAFLQDDFEQWRRLRPWEFAEEQAVGVQIPIRRVVQEGEEGEEERKELELTEAVRENRVRGHPRLSFAVSKERELPGVPQFDMETPRTFCSDSPMLTVRDSTVLRSGEGEGFAFAHSVNPLQGPRHYWEMTAVGHPIRQPVPGEEESDEQPEDPDAPMDLCIGIWSGEGEAAAEDFESRCLLWNGSTGRVQGLDCSGLDRSWEPTFRNGDVIGMCVDVERGFVEVYKNSRRVGRAAVPGLDSMTAIHPVVGLRVVNDAVEVNCDARRPRRGVAVEHADPAHDGASLTVGQAEAAFSRDKLFYFELSVLSCARNKGLSLGISCAKETMRCHPGTSAAPRGGNGEFSFGLVWDRKRSDNQPVMPPTLKAQAEAQKDSAGVCYGNWSETVGCGYDPDEKIIFFTMNGVLYVPFDKVTLSGEPFATFASETIGDQVELNFGLTGLDSFAFDMATEYRRQLGQFKAHREQLLRERRKDLIMLLHHEETALYDATLDALQADEEKSEIMLQWILRKVHLLHKLGRKSEQIQLDLAKSRAEFELLEAELAESAAKGEAMTAGKRMDIEERSRSLAHKLQTQDFDQQWNVAERRRAKAAIDHIVQGWFQGKPKLRGDVEALAMRLMLESTGAELEELEVELEGVGSALSQASEDDRVFLHHKQKNLRKKVDRLLSLNTALTRIKGQEKDATVFRSSLNQVVTRMRSLLAAGARQTAARDPRWVLEQEHQAEAHQATHALRRPSTTSRAVTPVLPDVALGGGGGGGGGGDGALPRAPTEVVVLGASATSVRVEVHLSRDSVPTTSQLWLEWAEREDFQGSQKRSLRIEPLTLWAARCCKFQRLWQCPSDESISLMRPTPPEGFFCVGDTLESGGGGGGGGAGVLVVRDCGDVAPPEAFERVWASSDLAEEDTAQMTVTAWRMVPPAGFVALGVVFGAGDAPPSPAQFRCVRAGAASVSAPRGAEASAAWTAATRGDDSEDSKLYLSHQGFVQFSSAEPVVTLHCQQPTSPFMALASYERIPPSVGTTLLALHEEEFRLQTVGATSTRPSRSLFNIDAAVIGALREGCECVSFWSTPGGSGPMADVQRPMALYLAHSTGDWYLMRVNADDDTAAVVGTGAWPEAAHSDLVLLPAWDNNRYVYLLAVNGSTGGKAVACVDCHEGALHVGSVSGLEGLRTGAAVAAWTRTNNRQGQLLFAYGGTVESACVFALELSGDSTPESPAVEASQRHGAASPSEQPTAGQLAMFYHLGAPAFLWYEPESGAYQLGQVAEPAVVILQAGDDFAPNRRMVALDCGDEPTVALIGTGDDGSGVVKRVSVLGEVVDVDGGGEDMALEGGSATVLALTVPREAPSLLECETAHPIMSTGQPWRCHRVSGAKQLVVSQALQTDAELQVRTTPCGSPLSVSATQAVTVEGDSFWWCASGGTWGARLNVSAVFEFLVEELPEGKEVHARAWASNAVGEGEMRVADPAVPAVVTGSAPEAPRTVLLQVTGPDSLGVSFTPPPLETVVSHFLVRWTDEEGEAQGSMVVPAVPTMVLLTAESAHPYENNMHETIEYEVDTSAVTIVFDPQTQLENKYDYLEFSWQSGDGQQSRRCTGVTERESYEPFVIDNNRFSVLFHTDGSNVEWGWKFRAMPGLSATLSGLASGTPSFVTVAAVNDAGISAPTASVPASATPVDTMQKSLWALDLPALQEALDNAHTVRNTLRANASRLRELNKLFSRLGLPQGTELLLSALFKRDFDGNSLMQLMNMYSFETLFGLPDAELKALVGDLLSMVVNENYAFSESRDILCKRFNVRSMDVGRVIEAVMKLATKGDMESFEFLLGLALPVVGLEPSHPVVEMLYGLLHRDAGRMQAVLPRLAKLLAPQLGVAPNDMDVLIRVVVTWVQGLQTIAKGGKSGLQNGSTVEVVEDMFRSLRSARLLPPEVPLDMVCKGMRGIIALSVSDMPAFMEVAAHLGDFDPAKAESMLTVVKKYGKFAATSAETAEEAAEKALAAPGVPTDVTESDMFKMFDKDGSNLIEFSEFKEILRWVGLSLSDEKALKLFAEADSKGEDHLNYEEFSYALKLLREQCAGDALAQMGFSMDTIIRALVGACLFLLLLFMFIFVGIAAFTTGSTFGAVVNSIMPIGAGLGASGGKEGGDPKDDEEKVNKTVDGVLEMYSP